MQFPSIIGWTLLGAVVLGPSGAAFVILLWMGLSVIDFFFEF